MMKMLTFVIIQKNQSTLMRLGFIFFFIACLFLNHSIFSQAYFTSKASGRWNSASTWKLESGISATNIPGATDSVVILNSHQVKVDSIHQCLSLSVRQSAGLTLDSITSFLTVINNLSLIDGATAIVSSGNLTVSGNSTISLATLTQTGGIVSIIGLVNASNTSLVSGNTIIDVQSGIFNTVGGLTLSALTRPSELRIGTGIANVVGALITFGGAAKIRFTGDGSLVLAGLVTMTNTNFVAGNGRVVYVGIPGTNQNVASLNYNRLVVTGIGAGTKVISGTVNVSDTLTLLTDTLQINSGSLTMANNSTIIRAAGKILSAPNFAGQVDLIYNNVQKDTTGPELPTNVQTLKNLTIANPGGIALNANAYVNQKIILTAGELDTRSSILFIRNIQGGLTDDPAVEQTGGFVTGLIERNIGASTGIRLFPFGTGTVTARRSFELNYTTAPSTAGSLQVRYVNTAADQQTGLPVTEGSVKLISAVPFYWRAIAVGGLSGGNYSLQLTAQNITGIQDYLSLRILKRVGDGADWQLDGVAGVNTGTNLSPTVLRTGMIGFSDFAIGLNESTTTSVNDFITRNQINIYPNPLPNGSPLNVFMKNAQGLRCAIVIMDIQGREVFRKSWIGGVDTYQVSLPSSIPQGLYQVVITQGKLQRTQSLLMK
jgi:hypothetical protein